MTAVLPADVQTETRSPARRVGPLLLLAMLAWAMCFQGTRGIWEPDEGRYSAVALEMLRTGDWLHPQLNDAHPHYTKPPITYWALAASFGLFGQNEWAARLPNALAYAATAAGAFVLARRLVPGKELLAAIVYATSAGPFIAANVVSTDTLLACWETWAVAGFAAAWTSKSERGRQGGLLLTGVMFGLAFATKGPPGLLPLGGLLPAAVWVRGWRGLRRCFSFAGVAAFFLIGGGWFAAVCIDRPALIHYFLKDEVVARVASDEHKRNGQWYGWAWIYVPAILGGTLPWTHVWLVAAWKRLRVARTEGARALLPGDDAGRLLALWILVPLAVLCVAQSRMHLYVLPLLVPLALVIARQLPAGALRRKPTKWALTAWCVGLLGFRFGLALAASNKDTRAYLSPLPPAAEVGGVLFVDTRPRYGLELYGYGPVQSVDFRPDGSEGADEDEGGVPRQALAAALAAARSPRLLVVRRAEAGEVEAILSAAGLAARPAGRDFEDKTLRLVAGP